MALVAPDEVEKNNSPLYRYRIKPSTGREETCLGRPSTVGVFLPAQSSGRGPGQPEGFQDEHVHPQLQGGLHVGADGHVPCGASGCVPHAKEPEG
jgi:hypothetical protein